MKGKTGDGIEYGRGRFECWPSGLAVVDDSWTVSRGVPLLVVFDDTMGREVTRVIVIKTQRRMKYQMEASLAVAVRLQCSFPIRHGEPQQLVLHRNSTMNNEREK